MSGTQKAERENDAGAPEDGAPYQRSVPRPPRAPAADRTAAPAGTTAQSAPLGPLQRPVPKRTQDLSASAGRATESGPKLPQPPPAQASTQRASATAGIAVAVQALACASACLFLIGVQETIDGIGGSHTGGFILFAAFTIGMLIVDRFGRKQLFVLCPPDQAAVLARKTTRHSIAVLVVVTIFFIVQTELNSPSGRAPGGKYVVIAVMLCMAGAFLFRFYFPEGVRARETR